MAHAANTVRVPGILHDRRRIMRLTPLVGGASILVVAATACSSSESGASNDSPAVASSTSTPTSEPCSNGPRYTAESSFPYEAKDPFPGEPACTLHCGEVPKGASGFATAGALPSGACEGTSSCNMAAEALCSCPGSAQQRGPVNGYRCRCVDGSWKCSLISQGASLCTCDDGDAG